MPKSFSELLQQLRKRALLQWGLAYLGAAWVLLQVVSLISDQFGWPLVLQRSLTVLAGIGFVVVLVIAWYHGEEGRQRIRAMELVILAAVLVLAGSALVLIRRTTPVRASVIEAPGAPVAAAAPARNSIAVLPFANLSSDDADDYFSEGMTEELIHELANSPDLRVASRTASFQFKDRPADLREVGRSLNVANLLEGSVRKSGTRVRITVQLIQASDGFHIWSRTYERGMSDIFAVQDGIAREIVSALQVTLRGDQPNGPPTANLEAYDAYLRGRYHYSRSGVNSDSGIIYLERAVGLDPGFADGFAALALACVARNFNLGNRTPVYREKAFVAIEKALALNPMLAEVYVARANLAWTIETGFRHEPMARDLRRALDLNPRLASAHRGLGSLYSHVGLNDRALAEFRTTLTLDPHDNEAEFRIPRILIFQGHYAEALATVDREANADRNWHRPLALWHLGRVQEAEAAVRHGLTLFEGVQKADWASVYAIILAGTNRPEEAEVQIARAVQLGSGYSHFHHAAYSIASAYALMDHRDQAMQWLHRVVKEGFPNYELFARDPNLDKLRRDATFRSFLEEQRKLWEHHAEVL